LASEIDASIERNVNEARVKAGAKDGRIEEKRYLGLQKSWWWRCRENRVAADAKSEADFDENLAVRVWGRRKNNFEDWAQRIAQIGEAQPSRNFPWWSHPEHGAERSLGGFLSSESQLKSLWGEIPVKEKPEFEDLYDIHLEVYVNATGRCYLSLCVCGGVSHLASI